MGPRSHHRVFSSVDRTFLSSRKSSLLLLRLKQDAPSNFAARPHGEEGKGQRRQNSESHTHASLPLSSFAKLHVLPSTANCEPLPASANVVSVSNRRHNGLICRTALFGLRALGKKFCVEKPLDQQTFCDEPATFIVPADAQRRHRLKPVVSEGYTEPGGELPVLSLKCPATRRVANVVFVATEVMPFEIDVPPKILDQRS